MVILIGVPNFSNVNPLFLDSVFDLGVALGDRYHGNEHRIIWARDTRTYRHFARQSVWDIARRENVDGILWIDDDMVFNGNDALTLIESGKPIVSALYYVRDVPTYPCMYVRSDGVGGRKGYSPIIRFPKPVLIPVDLVGMGLMWVAKEVVQKLESPFAPRDDEPGEDRRFCEAARAAGFEILVNTAISIGHISEHPRILDERFQPQLGGPMLPPDAVDQLLLKGQDPTLARIDGNLIGADSDGKSGECIYSAGEHIGVETGSKAG